MYTNISKVNVNTTFHKMINYLNLNISAVNQSEVTPKHLSDYLSNEKEQLMVFEFVFYIVGPLIILSNLTVVISSGLVLINGQYPKSTYLLLGNVALADIIIGLCLIFKLSVDPMNSNPLCMFQMGLVVGSALVSVYSTGLIAIDRYIYILYGLYYQRWITTTRVRGTILIIWIIGIILGFMPTTGMVRTDLMHKSCSYVAVFPDALILLITSLSMVPVIVVVILYSKILVQALKVVKVLNTSVGTPKHDIKVSENSKKSIFHGTKTDSSNTSQTVEITETTHPHNLTGSSSIHDSYKPEDESAMQPASMDDHVENEAIITNITDISMKRISKRSHHSTISVCPTETNISENEINIPEPRNSRFNKTVKKVEKINKIILKPSGPNKWRAITIVLLTSGSFIFTWTPFFITVTLFVFCEEKITNDRCLYIRYLLGGPFSALAFVNSALNPLIYAWWNKGFRNSIKKYFRKIK